MEFQFWVPENVQLPARISQRSNLKYIKTVMDHLDDRLRADFLNSCLGFLTDVPEIHFSAQLIQALVCRGIRCDKSHELWFNVQGHLTRFGLQEYAIVTALHAGLFPKGDRYTKALEKRRLKEKYFKSLEKISCAQLEKTFVHVSTPQADRYKLRLALIVEGVITTPDNNGFRGTWARKMSDAKMKNEKDVSYTIHEFSIVMQLHVHATLCPTEAERDFPYITSLVPFPYRSMQIFDDLVRSVVGSQFHKTAPPSRGHDGNVAGDGHDDELSAGEGNDDDGSKADESGHSSHDTSSETSAGDTEDDEDPRDDNRVHYPLQWVLRLHLDFRLRGVDRL
ncbi:Hypothetical predicted protein [Olea europaea subsp. europaea]|uniref:DUF1985 domain-containing protein n=1 Tax=Olea europaea subsp. europaea TaxID=158383 RepID=A0A8S0TV35_OLEEU|nr:Hypothetical predicted protein [Olea europaea subsp. europaea]